MRQCPVCKDYGDVWEVAFANLQGRRAVMCFECDTIWDTVDGSGEQVVDDFASLMKKAGVAADWKQIRQIQRVLPDQRSP